MFEPIRILQMIGSLEIGGSQSMIINLYNSIDREKVQFDFVIDHPENMTLAPVVEKLGAKIIYMPTFRGTNIFEVKKAWNALFIKHPEYKILHSHVRSYASIYLPIAHKHGVTTIIHSHSTSNGRGFSSIVKRMMQYPLRFQADYFFGCSREAGEWLFGKRVVSGANYHMLQNAIDTEKYCFSPEIRERYREDFNIDKKTIVYVHVGRFIEAKNHLFLLEIFKGLLKKHPDSLLLMVGDGALRGQIEEKIKHLNIQNKVSLLGSRDDVQNILQAADCFLFPSKWEGLPVTVIEAQAVGLPCFVSENVTKDVNISPLAKNLPINQGVSIWVNDVGNAKLGRQNVVADIIKAGFDIKSSAQWITEFYRGLFNE